MKRPVGRPPKKGAKKSGDLNSGECRFSFISEERTIENLKEEAKRRGITIKQLMSEVLIRFAPSNKNEEKLRRYQSKKIS